MRGREAVKRTREIIIVTALALLANFGAQTLAASAASATSYSAPAASNVSSGSCKEDINYNFVDTGTPQGGSTWWNDNTCSWYQRVHIKCWDQLTNQFQNYNGGWVVHAVVDSAWCKLVGMEMVRFGWQFKTSANGAISQKWLWIRPGFRPRPANARTVGLPVIHPDRPTVGARTASA
jgi:hypothetical protein